VRSEAAFAALAGTCPIPASSGNTLRHRLNRSGDRRLNRALTTIVIVRMRTHAPTKAYVARRRAQGRTTKEIMRSLERYITRQRYRTLAAAHPIPITPRHDIEASRDLRRLHFLERTESCQVFRRGGTRWNCVSGLRSTPETGRRLRPRTKKSAGISRRFMLSCAKLRGVAHITGAIGRVCGVDQGSDV
jgi:hypothetical protein